MGVSVDIEDQPFRHYTLKHKVVAWVSTRLFDGVTYTVRNGLLKGLKRRGGLGWVPSSAPLTEEHRFWESLNLAGKVVYDVGAFHGLLALFFAKRAQSVVCFEPNTRNNTRLQENLKLNGVQNVRVIKAGVGSRRETLRMVGSPLMPGGSSLDAKVSSEILRVDQSAVAEEIPVVTLDEAIAELNLTPPGFVKIDIEGWELEALRGAKATLEQYQPEVFLEMHGETIREKKRKAQEIVDYLWSISYRNILHIESGAKIRPENAPDAMRGHLYCKAGDA